jgi:hypothetical protein
MRFMPFMWFEYLDRPHMESLYNRTRISITFYLFFILIILPARENQVIRPSQNNPYLSIKTKVIILRRKVRW